MFEETYRVDAEPNAVGPDDVARVAGVLGGDPPAGYAEYVTELGEGLYSGYVRVYPPQRVLAEYEAVRGRLREHWTWDEDGGVATRGDLATAVIVADTLDGDEVHAHPASGRLLLLPRHEDGVYAFGYDLCEVLRWLTTAGVLTDPLPEPQTFETTVGQRVLGFTAGRGASRARTEAAVTELADGARRDLGGADDPFVQQYLPRVGGYAFVSGEDDDLWTSVTVSASAPQDDVDDVIGALEGVGLRLN